MTTLPRTPIPGDMSAARRRIVLAVLLATAGGLHIAALPSHLLLSLDVAAFFVAAGVGQLLAAGLVALRPSRGVVAAVIIGNLIILAVWTISRSVGMPFGPDGNEPEAISALDALATLLEVIVVAGALLVVRRVSPQTRRPMKLNSGVLATLTLVWVVVGGLGTTLADAHDHVGDAQRHQHSDPTGGHSNQRATPAPDTVPSTGHSSQDLGERRTDLDAHVGADHHHLDANTRH